MAESDDETSFELESDNEISIELEESDDEIRFELPTAHSNLQRMEDLKVEKLEALQREDYTDEVELFEINQTIHSERVCEAIISVLNYYYTKNRKWKRLSVDLGRQVQNFTWIHRILSHQLNVQ